MWISQTNWQALSWFELSRFTLYIYISCVNPTLNGFYTPLMHVVYMVPLSRGCCLHGAFVQGVLCTWCLCPGDAVYMVPLSRGCCVHGAFVQGVLCTWCLCPGGAVYMVPLSRGCCLHGAFVQGVLCTWCLCPGDAVYMVPLSRGCCVHGAFVQGVLCTWCLCPGGAVYMVPLSRGCCVHGAFVQGVLWVVYTILAMCTVVSELPKGIVVFGSNDIHCCQVGSEWVCQNSLMGVSTCPPACQLA